MVTINLRKFYPWYRHDEFVEITEEMLEAMKAADRQQAAYERRMYYHHAYYSLDLGDNIEASAFDPPNDDPEALVLKMEQHCDLCRALNSLPEKQGRRVEGHYLLQKKLKEMAREEGVIYHSIRLTLRRGIRNMRKYLQSID